VATDLFEIPVFVSLAVVVVTLGAAVGASLLRSAREKRAEQAASPVTARRTAFAVLTSQRRGDFP
jgi:hypothetical protein